MRIWNLSCIIVCCTRADAAPGRDQEDYEVIRKVGRGKYSEVFEGVNVVNDQVIHVLQHEVGRLSRGDAAKTLRKRSSGFR